MFPVNHTFTPQKGSWVGIDRAQETELKTFIEDFIYPVITI